MNPSLPGFAAEPLLFSWESPRRRKMAIIAFLALSLVGHALCFYVFQIVYPPTIALLPPPARVSLITPASEEGRTLLRWIDAEDPVLAFRTQRAPEALETGSTTGFRLAHPEFRVPRRRAVCPSKNSSCNSADRNICLVFTRARCLWRSDIARPEFCRIQRRGAWNDPLSRRREQARRNSLLFSY